MKGAIGDWLIIPAGEHPPLQGRDRASWEAVHHTPSATLWVTYPSTNWQGWPFASFETPQYKGWICGELWPGGVSSLAEVFERPDQARHLNGYFIGIAVDKKNAQWQVITSRFGLVHAYYSLNDRRIGSYYPVVAYGADDLDWEGITAFFQMGFFHGHHTYFQGVSILPMATRNIFSPNLDECQSQRYWHWEHHPDLRLSFPRAVEAFGEVFHQVINDAVWEGRIGLPISGGLDSRSTVVPISQPSQYNRLKDRIWSYSYGYTDDSIETRISREIADAVGLPFQAFTIRPYLFDQAERVFEWTEGFQDITQCRQAFVRDELAQHTDVLVGGLWGDVWHDEMGFLHHPPTGNDELAVEVLKKMSKRGYRWLVKHVVRPNVDMLPTEPLLHHIHVKLTTLQHIRDVDFRVKAYKTEEWSFRWSIPPIRVFQSGTLPKLVFYDTRLTDFFQAVPTQYLSGRRLQIEYIKRFSPELARIPWQVYGVNLYWYRYFNSWLLPLRAWRKLVRILRRQCIVQRNWEVQLLFSERERNHLRDWLLDPALPLHHYVERRETEKLVDQFLSLNAPDGAIGYTVSMLLTFSMWLELVAQKIRGKSSSGGT